LSLSAPNEINKVPDELLTKEINPETFQNYVPSHHCDGEVPEKVLTKVTKSEAIQSYPPSLNSEIGTREVPAIKQPADVNQGQQPQSLPANPNIVGREISKKPLPLLALETQLNISSSNELPTVTSRTMNQPPSSHESRELGRKSFSKIVNQKEDPLKFSSSKQFVNERVTGYAINGCTSSRKAWTASVNHVSKQKNANNTKVKKPSNAVGTQLVNTAVKGCTTWNNASTPASKFRKANQQLSTTYLYFLSNEIIKQRWTSRRPQHLYTKPRQSQRNPFLMTPSFASFVVAEYPAKGWRTLSNCLGDWVDVEHKIYHTQREIHTAFYEDISKQYPYQNFHQPKMLIKCKIQLNSRGKSAECQVDICCEELRFHSSYHGNERECAIWARIHNSYYMRFVRELRRRFMIHLKPLKEDVFVNQERPTGSSRRVFY